MAASRLAEDGDVLRIAAERADVVSHPFQALDDVRFHYVPVFTGTQDRINSGLLQEVLGRLGDYDYYIVGHHDFLASMQTMLAAKDVARSQINVDDFG